MLARPHQPMKCRLKMESQEYQMGTEEYSGPDLL
jgi:hypothetical protein